MEVPYGAARHIAIHADVIINVHKPIGILNMTFVARIYKIGEDKIYILGNDNLVNEENLESKPRICIDIKENTSSQHVERKAREAIEGFCKRDFTKKITSPTQPSTVPINS